MLRVAARPVKLLAWESRGRPHTTDVEIVRTLPVANPSRRCRPDTLGLRRIAERVTRTAGHLAIKLQACFKQPSMQTQIDSIVQSQIDDYFNSEATKTEIQSKIETATAAQIASEQVSV